MLFLVGVLFFLERTTFEMERCPSMRRGGGREGEEREREGGKGKSEEKERRGKEERVARRQKGGQGGGRPFEPKCWGGTLAEGVGVEEEA